MVIVALNERTFCEDFDLDAEICYFKIGVQGMVSFHGKNYNRKIKLSDQEIKDLTNKPNYYPLNSSCYINLDKIKSISEGVVTFGSGPSDTKQLPVNRRKQYVIEQLFLQRSKSKDLKLTK
jgi:hypothetical protein